MARFEDVAQQKGKKAKTHAQCAFSIDKARTTEAGGTDA